jgi:hypothetical protein
MQRQWRLNRQCQNASPHKIKKVIMNRIKKRMKSTSQSWHLGSGVGVGEVSVCRQPAPQKVVVTFRTIVDAEIVGQEVVIGPVGEVVGQSVHVPHEFVLLLLVIEHE